jgi:protein translocase SecG subunit
MEILLILQIIIVVALVAVILVQRSDSDGFTGNSSPTSFMSGRAQANLFTKTTAILATAFIVNSLVLGYIASHTERTTDIIDEAAQELEAENADTESKNETIKELENIEVPQEDDEQSISNDKVNSEELPKTPEKIESEVPVEN